jgi:hypothetical protein
LDPRRAGGTGQDTVQIKEKQKQERAARQQSLDLTKYDVTVGDTTYQRLPKRHAIFRIVRHLCRNGVTPEEINAAVPSRPNTMFRSVEGEVDSKQFIALAQAKAQQEAKGFEAHRFYLEDAELIRSRGRTYAFSNQWGSRTFEAINDLLKAFPDKGIGCSPAT